VGLSCEDRSHRVVREGHCVARERVICELPDERVPEMKKGRMGIRPFLLYD